MTVPEEAPPSYASTTSPPAYRTSHHTFELLFVARQSSSTPAYIKLLVDGIPVYRVESRRHAHVGSSTNLVVSALSPDAAGPSAFKADASARCRVHGSRKNGVFEIEQSPNGNVTRVERMVKSTKSVSSLVQRYAEPAQDTYSFTSGQQRYHWRPRPQPYANGLSVNAAKSIDKQWDRCAMELLLSDADHHDEAPMDASGTDSKGPTAHSNISTSAKMVFFHYAPMTFVPPPPRPSLWTTGRPIGRIEVMDAGMAADDIVLALLTALCIEKVHSDATGLGDEGVW